MDMKQCILCQKLFYGNPHQLSCPNCAEEEAHLLMKLRHLIYEEPDCGFESLETLGIKVSVLESWLREGKLSLPAESRLSTPCMRCGRPIPSGKLCKVCKPPFEEMAKQIQNKY